MPKERVFYKHSVQKSSANNRKNDIFIAYEHTYNQEIRDINRAISTLENGNKKYLQEKYRKYFELIHA